MKAAAVLACSTTMEHRIAAFRLATCAYELFGSSMLPLDQALRIVLSRLSNFPSLLTRKDVSTSLAKMPLSFAAESISAADSHAVTVNREIFHFTDFQHGLWTALNDGNGIAIAAPTSSGKSFVLQSYILSLYEYDSPCVVVYIVPTRALIAQVARDLENQLHPLGDAAPTIHTVPLDDDESLESRAIYVMTQERLQLLLSTHVLFKADVVIVDEAHSIADGARGILLQWVVDDLLERNSETQAMFASPSIRNLGVFRNLFGLKNLSEISSIEPTVGQNFLVVSVESASKGVVRLKRVSERGDDESDIARFSIDQTMASRIEKLVHTALRLGRHQSNIIYADGPDDAEKIAIQLADMLADREASEDRLALAELAAESVHPSYVLIECVKRGVAFHYSNIPTQLRREIELAVSKGAIDFLVCTSTLLQGVNLPVKNIFMCLPKKGKRNSLDSIDFWNLSGRAGRLRQEFHGNIFLIDYDKWEKKPLSGPKDAPVSPAMLNSISLETSQLVELIADSNSAGNSSNSVDLEATFVRLFSDLKRSSLISTLEKIGLPSDSPAKASIIAALDTAAAKVSLPAELVRRSANISAHKQQRLFDFLNDEISSSLFTETTSTLIPKHPRERDAYASYAEIFRVCHHFILGIDTSKNLHRFHAVMAVRWMQGMPLPQIVDEQIRRRPAQSSRTTIRSTLDTIESQIRFQAVRLMGCYTTLLTYALQRNGREELVSRIPSVALYLELGASDRTMISFISLGLSRVAAMKLNEFSAQKNLTAAEAKEWLKTRPLEQFGLSALLLEEVRAIVES